MNVDDLAEQAAPHLATLIYPGDNDTPAFPLNVPVFQPHTLPEGMADAEAEELGLPTNNFGILFLKALFHTLTTQLGVTMVDAAELADERAELAALRATATLKLNQPIEMFTKEDDEKIARLTVSGYDFAKLHITRDQLRALATVAQKRAN